MQKNPLRIIMMNTNTPTPKPHLFGISAYKQGKTSADDTIIPVKLSSNENPYGCSPKAYQAYVKAGETLHRYPEGSCRALREVLARTHTLNAEQIICGAGSDELINLIIMAYAGEGDEVLMTQHAFLMYKIYSIANNATPVQVKETDLHADIELLLAAVTERTKIVFLANPNNPTGTYLAAPIISEFRRRLPPHILFVLDGAYAECATATDYDDGLELSRSTNNTIMLRTFSKLYGLPALRIGWMHADAAIIDAVSRIKSPFNVTAPAQAAAIAATEDTEYLHEQIRINAKQRAILHHGLTALGLAPVPSQGNFILVKCADADHAQHLIAGLEAQHIYVRDVTSYSLPEYMRISIGTIEENQILLGALRVLL
jgi:histidinol-phosphate aminotransferase